MMSPDCNYFGIWWDPVEGEQSMWSEKQKPPQITKKTPKITRKLQIARLIFSAHQQHVGQGEARQEEALCQGCPCSKWPLGEVF